ncbi:hypothetical protein ASA1KI_01180 [Opitutales bacterium ASA1]|uniref:hypothetical protein n=1 Tax=Congregicoccus parvus TaxID=3081749 RepID=UPI002B2839BF|nr:hypothetical protein ASA1KI_01180 [Opitutales bacterium ASA1]
MRTPATLPPLFDADAWIGAWPFALRPEQTAAGLAARLAAAGIARALVSPLAAVLAPDSMPANEHLLRETRPYPELLPLPLLDLRLSHWRDDLARLAADARIRAIRIAPGWHHFSWNSREIDELADALHLRRLGLVVTARLEDERQRHHALRIRGPSVSVLSRLLRRLAPVRVLCTGLYLREILALAEHDNLFADTAMAEWDDTFHVLLEKVSARRLCFGSLSPFLSLPANVAKIRTARLGSRVHRDIACSNLERFLSP